jgi:amino acid transporter
MRDVQASSEGQLTAEDFGYTQELKRVLGVPDLVILGLSMAVPISVSVIYGYVVGAAKGSIAAVYLLTAIGMVLTGNSYARMSQAFPLAGGGYAFVSRGMNKLAGFLIGWAMAGMYIVLLPLLYTFGAYALQTILPAVPVYLWLAGFVIVNTWVNYRGLEVTRDVLKYMLFAGLIIYLWTVIACLVFVAGGKAGTGFTAAPFYAVRQFDLAAVMVGISIAVFNFGGPDLLTTLGEETKGGARTLGIGVLLSFGLLGALYVLLAFVAALVWPDYASLGNPDTAFYEIVARAGGPILKSAFVIAVVTTVFGSCIGSQACSSRLLYAMGRDNMFPKMLCKVHPKYHSPYVGVIAIGAIATFICLAFPGKAQVMTSMVNFSMLLCWSFINITTIHYFIVKQGSRRYFRDLACPVLGFLVTGHAFYSLDAGAKAAGLIWLGIGVLFAAYLKYIKKVDLSFASDSGI